jgi:lactoylglutathione lyase
MPSAERHQRRQRLLRGMMEIQRVDHIGIRVIDEARTLAFYRKFGFDVTFRAEGAPVVIVRNAQGVELNFIVNGTPPPEGKNVLMDVADKHPGYTHIAFRVASMVKVIAELESLGIEITEGPVPLGSGVSVFIRDPDGNVIELREHDAGG